MSYVIPTLRQGVATIAIMGAFASSVYADGLDLGAVSETTANIRTKAPVVANAGARVDADASVLGNDVSADICLDVAVNSINDTCTVMNDDGGDGGIQQASAPASTSGRDAGSNDASRTGRLGMPMVPVKFDRGDSTATEAALLGLPVYALDDRLIGYVAGAQVTSSRMLERVEVLTVAGNRIEVVRGAHRVEPAGVWLVLRQAAWIRHDNGRTRRLHLH